MAINKVVYGNNTLIDLTKDTVNSGNLLDGIKAHGADGELVVGGVKVGNIFVGTCTGQAAKQQKAVVVSQEQAFLLKTGTFIAVKFDANNTYSATATAPVSLNVNSTGAKQVYGAATATPTGTNTTYFGRANYLNYYVYDGTYWVWAGSSADNNTTYSAMSTAELVTGTATASRVVRSDYLKTAINQLIEAAETNASGYSVCTTSADDPNKVVTVDDEKFKVRVGSRVSVKFSETNTAANPTINVNGTGAKQIWYNDAVLTGGWGAGYANRVTSFIYDGTYWVWMGHSLDINTTYSKMSQTEANTGTATTARSISAAVLKNAILQHASQERFILLNQSLSFTNLSATITDSRVTANTFCEVYFTDATLSAASNAGVIVDSGAGKITFTAVIAPSTTLVCNIVCINP